MQWIILIGNEELSLSKIKIIDHIDSIKNYDVHEKRYCVDYGKDHIFYVNSESLINDYEKQDLMKIPYEKPSFIMMTYTSEERMRKVLQQNNFPKGIFIDNDFGLIVPIEEFIKLGMPVDTR